MPVVPRPAILIISIISPLSNVTYLENLSSSSIFYLSNNLPTCPSIHLSIYVSIQLSIYQRIYLSVSLSACLPVCPTIFVSIYLIVDLSI